jgi:hypothetical protein
MENSEFLDILIKNDKDEIRNYVLENGKEGKSFCPISFEKENKDVEKTKN